MSHEREGRLLADVNKGAEAEHELRLTGEAFKALRAGLVEAWEKTNARDTTGREKLWVAMTQVSQVEFALRAAVSNGHVAAKEIEAIRKAGEPKKRFGII